MSILILILIVMTFIASIVINIFLYLELKEVRVKLDLNENSIKMWLDDEVKMKRIYKNLSEKLSRDLNNINEEENPCMRCGKCINVCPVGIEPVLIKDNLNNKDKLKKLNPKKCISCGLCSYICPSKINLRDIVEDAKRR